MHLFVISLFIIPKYVSLINIGSFNHTMIDVFDVTNSNVCVCMYILSNRHRYKMVGCWLGYMHCLAAKKPIHTGKLQPIYFSGPLASYMSGSGKWLAFTMHSDCTYLVSHYISCHYLATSVRFTVGSRKQNQRDTNLNQKRSKYMYTHTSPQHVHVWPGQALKTCTLWHNWCSCSYIYYFASCCISHSTTPLVP